MTANPRPISIIILACIYFAVGVMGFIYHFREIIALQSDSLSIALTEVLAIVCGVFMLRGQNWARWLALAWILFHVIISAFNSMHQFLMHSLICAVIAWVLLHPTAARYFRGPQTESRDL
ncbi:MAG: hypothetical protein RB191_17360 [Terriglobia bacterium]|nr:hypothetical protein [Terriglobia bacterium]